MTPETWAPLLTVALAIAFAACRDASPASIVDADTPVPGDPAIYTPDGWPLRIGDRVTEEDRDRLREEFLSPYGWPIHVAGDQLYAARWDWPDEPHDYSRLVYAGHLPATMPWSARDEEQDLPQRFHGRIEYDPTPAYRIMFLGAERCGVGSRWEGGRRICRHGVRFGASAMRRWP